MPIFKWSGVDSSGRSHRGKTFANSQAQLDALLFSQQIALIRADSVSCVVLRNPDAQTCIHFFEQCAALLKAGVQLPVVLDTLAGYAHEALLLQIIIAGIREQVKAGNSLYHACCAYPQLFDHVSRAMIQAGEQSGALAGAMQALAYRLRLKHEFRKKVHAALLIPVITFLFFLASCGVIFGWIVPSFAQMLSRSNNLPFVTRILLKCSVLVSLQTFGVGIAVIGIIFFCIRYLRRAYGQAYSIARDRILLRLPYVSRIMLMHHMTSFFETISLLLQQSVLLVPALSIASQAVSNRVLRSDFMALCADVNQGLSLHTAMSMRPELFNRSMISMIATGEQVTDLSTMVDFVCKDMRSSLVATLSRLTTVVQPLLLAILGLLIAALIFAVYLPLISIPSMF